MDLKNNIDEQREYLQRNLAQLNTVVSAVLGVKTNLKVYEKKRYQGQTYFDIIDDKNIRDLCGVMAKAFTEVTISNFGIGWRDNGVSIDLHFNYVHINGGSNAAHFCTIDIIDDFVKIR